MRRYFLFFCFVLPRLLLSLQISHSVVPLLETLEKFPPEKYSQSYRQEIDRFLKRKHEKIRIVSYNILFDLFDEELKDKSYSWTERFPLVIASLENIKADIVCVQEAYPAQLNDLKEALKASFLCFVGEGKTGELNAIFYRKNRFELESHHDLPSASLELPLHPQDEPLVAKIPHFLPPDLEPGRQLTLVHLRDQWTGKTFTLMNTHLTFYRLNSRENQALFIQQLAERISALGRPLIVSGDLNTFPNRPDQNKLPFYDGDRICQIMQKVLQDSKDVALLGHIGPTSTALYNFFSRKNKPLEKEEDSNVILDHIFVSPEITVIINATEPSQVDGRFPSDHFPLIADILLP